MSSATFVPSNFAAAHDFRNGAAGGFHGYRVRYGEFPLPDFGVVREREEGELLVVEDFFELRNVRGEAFGNVEPPLHRRILDADVEHGVERPRAGFGAAGDWALSACALIPGGSLESVSAFCGCAEGGCRHRERCDKVCLHKFSLARPARGSDSAFGFEKFFDFPRVGPVSDALPALICGHHGGFGEFFGDGAVDGFRQVEFRFFALGVNRQEFFKVRSEPFHEFLGESPEVEGDKFAAAEFFAVFDSTNFVPSAAVLSRSPRAFAYRHEAQVPVGFAYPARDAARFWTVCF